MVHAGCVSVAGIHSSRTWTSGSFKSVRWNTCVHRLELGLFSRPKEFWGNGVRTHVNSKGKNLLWWKIFPRGGSNPQRCIKQDSEPNTLPTELFRPLRRDSIPVSRVKRLTTKPRRRITKTHSPVVWEGNDGKNRLLFLGCGSCI